MKKIRAISTILAFLILILPVAGCELSGFDWQVYVSSEIETDEETGIVWLGAYSDVSIKQDCIIMASRTFAGSETLYRIDDDEIVLLGTYPSVGIIVDGLTWVEQNGEYGALNVYSGEMVVPFQKFDSEPDFFSEGFSAVEIDGLYGFYNSQGELAIPNIYPKVYSFSDGVACVKDPDGNRYGFINQDGDLVVDYILSYPATCRNGLINVTRSGNPCFMTIDGTIVTSSDDDEYTYGDRGVYDPNTDYRHNYSVNSFYDPNYARISCEGLWGLIDRTGTVVVECIYDSLSDLDENGIAFVKKDGYYGYLAYGGTELVPCKYAAYDISVHMDPKFHDGFALVCSAETGLFGYVDLSGAEVIPCQYEEAEYFHNGIAVTKTDGIVTLINTSGDEIEIPGIPAEQVVSYLTDGLALVCSETGKKYGIFSLTGEEILPCEYDRIQLSESSTLDRIIVWKNNRCGILLYDN